jgi:hypothetical protein
VTQTKRGLNVFVERHTYVIHAISSGCRHFHQASLSWQTQIRIQQMLHGNMSCLSLSLECNVCPVQLRKLSISSAGVLAYLHLLHESSASIESLSTLTRRLHQELLPQMKILPSFVQHLHPCAPNWARLEAMDQYDIFLFGFIAS